MSLDGRQSDAPLTSAASLRDTFVSAERRDGTGLIGLEHEKLIYPADSWQPVPYEGPRGIGALLGRFVAEGWEPFREAEGLPIIALTRGSVTVSLEPGGQFELAGAPHPTARAAHEENAEHLRDLERHTRALGLRVVTLGYRPHGTVAEMPWMPKSRYGAMRETLGAAGSHALDMMLMTATGQVSLDWRDEADCALKVTTAARLTPVTVALFANSSEVRGQPSGFQTYRSRVWNDVDPARCGTPAFMVDGSFSYARYVDWALAAPLLFLRRGGRYLTPKLTFGELLEGGFDGKPAIASDWVDHLSTLFPEVRIKRVLEIRSADCNDGAMTGALGALMRGLLYDSQALREASAVLPGVPAINRALHLAAQRDGLDAKVDGHSVHSAAQQVVEIAKAGLMRLDPADAPLLEPLVRRLAR